jgi:glycerophosphoryl diester phosphodiesterase
VRTPIAHRGLHAAKDGRPENSLAAFDRACAHGFPAELDVRLTRDGEVVVFHDRTLRRLTGASGRVEDRAAAELRPLRLLGTDQRVPMLSEVLELVAGRVPLLIELKAGAPPTALERAVLVALDGYAGEVAIQSFKLRTVRALDRAEPPDRDRVGRALRVPRLSRRRRAAPRGPPPARGRRHRARVDGPLARAGPARAAVRRQLHLRGLRARASRQRPSKRGGRFSVNAAAASRASAVWASRP